MSDKIEGEDEVRSALEAIRGDGSPAGWMYEVLNAALSSSEAQVKELRHAVAAFSDGNKELLARLQESESSLASSEARRVEAVRQRDDLIEEQSDHAEQIAALSSKLEDAGEAWGYFKWMLEKTYGGPSPYLDRAIKAVDVHLSSGSATKDPACNCVAHRDSPDACAHCHGLKSISTAAIKFPDTYHDCPRCAGTGKEPTTPATKVCQDCLGPDTPQCSTCRKCILEHCDCAPPPATNGPCTECNATCGPHSCQDWSQHKPAKKHICNEGICTVCGRTVAEER